MIKIKIIFKVKAKEGSKNIFLSFWKTYKVKNIQIMCKICVCVKSNIKNYIHNFIILDIQLFFNSNTVIIQLLDYPW